MSENTGTIKITLKMDEKGSIKVLQTIGRESEKTGRKGKSSFDAFSQSAKNSASSIISLKTAVIGLVSVGLTVYLKSAASSLIAVASSFERYELQLKTITGSSDRAKASMAWITEFTAKTPYELNQVTESFVKLEAYGLNAPTWMRTLGDTAAAMGKGLNQTVEMFADAVVGEFERLKEFGVKTSTEGDKVTFKWSQNGRDMTQTADKTQSGISTALSKIFTRFDGSMDELSTSWAGMTSNMSDKMTMFKKDVMDSGPFEAMKESLGEFLDYLSTNEGQMDLKTWAQNTAVWVMQSFRVMTLGAGYFLQTLELIQGGWAKLKAKAKETQISYLDQSIKDLQSQLDPDTWSGKYARMVGGDKLYESNVKMMTQMIIKRAELAYEAEKENEASKQNYLEYIKIKNQMDGIVSKVDEWASKTNDIKLFGGAKDLDGAGIGKGKSDGTQPVTEKMEKDIQAALDKILHDIDAHWQKVTDVNQEFATDYKRISMTTYDFERDQLQARYNEYDKYVKDKVGLAMWFMMEEKKINDEEAKAAKESTDTKFSYMKDAFSGWATGYASTLNDMLWESEFSFDKIAISFGKMITQMIIQKETANLFDWAGGTSWGKTISSFFNAHGNAYDATGITAYAKGSMFTNTIVDKPTLFAHGGGLGVMGEKSPEVIAPLFRASNGDMGVKAVVSSPAQPVNITIEVIDKTGSDTKVTRQEPRFDSGAWVCGVVLENIKNNRGYKGSMNAALGRG